MDMFATFNETSYQYDDYTFDDYETFLYEGYAFERVIYRYVWKILVIVTFLLNIVVISVLLQKRMRSPTFMILVAISISDSLTGLVTLPSFSAVFKEYSLGVVSESNDTILNISDINPSYEDYWIKLQSTKTTIGRREGYLISEELCDGFMISKFFLAKTFHTASVWLTLFLALQRFLLVYFPFRKASLKMKRVVIICVGVFVLSPFMHIYHIFKDKSIKGHCLWVISYGDKCDFDCVHFWVSIVLGILIPSVLLTVFTVYFVYNISKHTQALHQTGQCSTQDPQDRNRGNRRLTMLVTSILVVFLIPELPYTGFLLYSVISAHANHPQNLKFNRAIHATYEILLVLSFSANFFIYSFINKQFRQVLKESILIPVYNRTCGRALSTCSGVRRQLPTSTNIADSVSTKCKTASTEDTKC